MRSIWRLARFMPIIAMPNLWSGKYMLNEVNTNELEQNLAEQQINTPHFVDALSQQEKSNDVQTQTESRIVQLSNQNVQLVQSQNAMGLTAQNQTKTESSQFIETEKASDKTDPQQIISDPKPLSQEQTFQKEHLQTTQAFDINNLQSNQVLISSTCPDYFIRYFELSNFKVIKSQQISEILIIKNSRNDIYRLERHNLNPTNDYYRKEIANFIRPPQEISTAQQAKQLLSLLSNDNFVVMAYIPHHEVYSTHIQEQTKSQFDSYTLSRKVDIKQLEKQYVSYAYRSSSNKDNYIIARTPQAANFLKMDTFNIGKPYLLHRSSKESGGESNFKQSGIKYKVSQFQVETNDENSINKLTHFYLNKIDNEVDMENKIRQMVMAGDKRKILVFYTQQQREEFHQKTQEILDKVARLQKKNVIVIKTSNQNVLKKVLKIEPDHFATVRLIDFHSQQQPLIGQSAQSFFSRQKYKGPFRMENLCEFVSSKKWEEYYEVKKKVPSTKAVTASELELLNNSLVLVEKQGCEGCRYVGESLEELKKVIRGLNLGGRLSKQLVYRFKIQDPRGLLDLKLRRYSIFNDNESFSVPSTTPRLYYISQGKRVDLGVEKSLSRLNNIRKGQSLENADDSVLADIIEKIRQQQNQASHQL